METPPDVSPSQSLKHFARQKARVAASNATAAINSMLAADLMGLCHSITVLAMSAPMQIHLFEATSPKHLSRQTGKHNLALCMLAVNELRKSYVAAGAGYALFDRAIGKIDGARGRTDDLESCAPSASAFPHDGRMHTEHLWTSHPEGYDISVEDIVSDVWRPFLDTGHAWS
ncbi:uncharacterized protein N0V89_010123 [Didymosphaeria variabile]|uniref:Uncharacterized protein n=1 Tax=Didymosphaeria variabile TaxID=1932322 RepID=A0A9W8XF40_9PLEO|nr:uncharacterized protein N0V89_010123 [Didymosphaeria variabile]KAJ4348745.1 hypothetical protein N0V89_010123 [Didymosphaeria variabile]